MQNALHSLSDYLLCHTNLWDKVDFFVIEKQMQFGRLRNPKAIRPWSPPGVIFYAALWEIRTR